MNDLRRLLLWLAVLCVLGVGVWGFHKNEATAARPNDPQNRRFRASHRIEVLGHEYFIPLRKMVLAWGAVALASAVLWPLATDARSVRVFGSWERPPGV